MQTNLFQVNLLTDGSSSIVVYLYADGYLQWGNSSRNEYASMEISVCSQSWEHPRSSQPDLPNALVTGSNVNIPGMWMFLIQDGELIKPGY